MTTFSDGGDGLHISNMAGLSSYSSSSGDMRFHLQILLDSKEKQLQQAGTLGQQLLAQRMELEERIRMLQDMELDSGEGDDMRDKYRELVDTIRAWDAENEQLSNLLGAKVNGTQSSTVELPRSEIERSVERSKASGSGTTAAQSSRRAKNAAHRADDVEFAFEIGSGLLTEVRRLQSLLAERDKAIQDMKEEKDDLDKTVESLRTALRHQEQSAEKYKEENWNLEVTLQELKTQLTESQVTAQRLESEQKRLTKALTTTREAVDQHKNEAERHNNAYQELKAKHDADVAQARRQAASLQRDKSDLQQTLDTLKAEHAKASKRLPRFPLTPNGTSTPTLNTPTIEEDEFFSTNGASTNRKKLDTSGLFPVDGFDEHDSSPEQSPTRPFFSPSHPNNEIEALQQRLAHAQRQINTLKGSLQREKELRIEYKRKLDAGAAAAEDEDDDNVEGIAQEDSNEPKPKVRLTPFRVGKVSRGGRGGGRGRGRGRGGMTLMQRLQAQSPNAEFPDDDDNVHVDAERSPVLSLPSALPRFSSEEPEVASDGEEEATAEKDVQSSPSPTPASKRASVDGMDPVFANILRRPTSGRAAGSPLRNSVLSRVPRPRPLAKRRGGAAFQEARPPSFANEPEALANELGDLDFRTLDDTFELPEPTKETAEFACQTEQEPSAPEEIARSPPLPEPFVPSMPVVSEIGIQVEPEPEPEPIRVEISSQTDAEPVLERAEVAVQHFDLTPSKVLISTGSATDPLPEPEPIPVPEPVPIPVVVDAITQTTDNTPSTQDADVQTAAMEPEPVTVTVDAIAQTIDNGPLTQDVDIQTLPAEPPVPLPEPIYIPVTVDAIAQTIDNTPSTQDMNTQTPTVEPAETREVQIQTPGVSVLEVSVQAEHIEEPAAVVTTPRTYVSPFAYASVGSSTEDLTLTVRPMVHTVPLEIEDDDGTETEMASIIETDTDDYVDARQSISLTTPTESMEDYHSIMTVTDNDFSSDSDAESIKASAVSSRNALVSPIPTTQDASTSTTLPEAGVLAEPEPVRTYESKGISAEPEEDRTPEPGPVVESEVSPVPPSKELRDSSMQTDEWIPPAAVAIAVPTPTSIPSSPVAPPSPALFRVGLTPQQFQFISPPPSAGPTTTALPATPSPSIAALRDSTSSFIPRPRTALSDRRQSIESTLSFAREDAIARSRTPSNVVDKTRPPMMVLPPPPRQPPPNSMPPPSFIPEHRQPKSSLTSREIPPPRPTSPPPPELIQRATTPIFGQLNVPGSRLKHHSSSAASSHVGGLRQPPSTASFDARNRREMSMTSLNSARQSADSHRSSMSSDRLPYDQPSQEGPTTPERTPLANRNSNAGTTDPAVIHAITQTMIGEFLYKYTRRAIGKGHGERRHKRFFWVHPYTRTLYWSSADPGSSNVSESSAKSAYIEGVRSVLDPNPMPPGIYQYSIVVATPQREMKFTAPTKERHDIWFSALQYLLTRPNNIHGTSPLRNGTASGLASPLSMDAELSGSDGQRPSAFASPHSQRSVRTAQTGMSGESWNSTPRGQRSHSQLSMRSSMGKRSGTPAAEYLRWSGAEPHSPTKSFENMQEQDDEMDFELHEDTTSDGGFEGLENVRACCDGRHTVGRSGKVIHHHHHHDQQQNQDTPTQRPPSRLREKHLDVHPSEVARPASPAWSFRSRTGSTASNDGGGFFSRFGTRRSMKTITADRR